jgi:hypothetical protein
VYAELKKFSLSIAAYKKVIEMNSRNKFAYYSLGKLYHVKQDGNSAVMNSIWAEKLFRADKQTDIADKAAKNLKDYYKIYKLKPESFAAIIKGKALPASSSGPTNIATR